MILSFAEMCRKHLDEWDYKKNRKSPHETDVRTDEIVWLKCRKGSIKLKNKFDTTFGDVYIEESDVPKGIEYINHYKVICPLIVSKQSLNAFNKAEILEPRHICTQNWSTLGIFNNRENAESMRKYLRTKLFQFVAYVFSSNAMTSISKVLMEHIPLQDFTSNSDIDWSQSIADIDKQLYKKYSLTQEEIDYIEATIKPME